jgi:hypothetical protein
MSHDPIVIVSAARTPMGSFQGDFSALAAHDLGGAAIKAAVERAGISPELVTEVLFGNCLMAGQGQAPARQAALKAGLPQSAGAVTLSVYPALKVAHTTSQVVTITLDGAGTGKEISLAFHRDAFCLAMAVLPDQLPGIDVFTAMDDQSGLSVRARRWTDGANAKQYIGVDALFGVRTLNSNLAVRLFDN